MVPHASLGGHGRVREESEGSVQGHARRVRCEEPCTSTNKEHLHYLSSIQFLFVTRAHVRLSHMLYLLYYCIWDHLNTVYPVWHIYVRRFLCERERVFAFQLIPVPASDSLVFYLYLRLKLNSFPLCILI